MPLYEFECTDPYCKHHTTTIFWVKELKDTIACEVCGREAKRVIALVADLFNKQYNDPNLGPNGFKGSYSEKQQYMKKLGVMEAGDAVGGNSQTGLSDHFNKQKENFKKENEERFKKKFDQVVTKVSKDF